MGLSVRGLVFVLVLVWSLAEQLVPKLGPFDLVSGSDLLHRELGFAAAYSPIHKVKDRVVPRVVGSRLFTLVHGSVERLQGLFERSKAHPARG